MFPLNQSTSFPDVVNISGLRRAACELGRGLLGVSADRVIVVINNSGRSKAPVPPPLKKVFHPLLLPMALFFFCLRSPSNAPAVVKSGLTIGLPPGAGGGRACPGGPKGRDELYDHRCAELADAQELDLA